MKCQEIFFFTHACKTLIYAPFTGGDIDICKRWATSSFACICKEKYGSIHEATRAIRLLIVWKGSTYLQFRPGGFGRGFVLHFHTCNARTTRFGLLYRNILYSYWPFVNEIFIRDVENLWQWKIASFLQRNYWQLSRFASCCLSIAKKNVFNLIGISGEMFYFTFYKLSVKILELFRWNHMCGKIV